MQHVLYCDYNGAVCHHFNKVLCMYVCMYVPISRSGAVTVMVAAAAVVGVLVNT